MPKEDSQERKEVHGGEREARRAGGRGDSTSLVGAGWKGGPLRENRGSGATRVGQRTIEPQEE